MNLLAELVNTMDKDILSVLVVGFGRMGKRHATAYQVLENFDLVGICGREYQRSEAEADFSETTYYLDAQTAIRDAKADVVCIATHIDSHDALARAAIDSGADVFLEKPVAQTLAESAALFSYAKEKAKKIVVGYVRKHDPLWKAFVEKGKQLGSPVVVRFLLDQPSTGDEWQIHQSILRNSSLTFDCAIHYADMMSGICGAKPVAVTGRAVRLHGNPSLNGNYGFLGVEFSDGSVGSFDSAWGPMVGARPSAVITATGPAGSVSIVSVQHALDGEETHRSQLVFEPAMTDKCDARDVEIIYEESSEYASENDAFVLQQRYLYNCIINDASMVQHYTDVLTSMLIVAAGDESSACGKTIELGPADVKP